MDPLKLHTAYKEGKKTLQNTKKVLKCAKTTQKYANYLMF